MNICLVMGVFYAGAGAITGVWFIRELGRNAALARRMAADPLLRFLGSRVICVFVILGWWYVVLLTVTGQLAGRSRPGGK